MTDPSGGREDASGRQLLLQHVREFLLESNIHVVTLLPFGVGALLLVAWGIIAQVVYRGMPPEGCLAITFAVFCFVVSLSGLIQIRRREAPGFLPNTSIRGVLPVLSGELLVAVTWTFGVLLLIMALASLE